MDSLVWEVVEILSDYDTTLFRALLVYDTVELDSQCDDDTTDLAEGLLIAILIDKSEPLIPEDEQVQAQVMEEAKQRGLQDVFQKLPGQIPLLLQVCIGNAVALSQGHNGWKPWERVRDIILGSEDN